METTVEHKVILIAAIVAVYGLATWNLARQYRKGQKTEQDLQIIGGGSLLIFAILLACAIWGESQMVLVGLAFAAIFIAGITLPLLIIGAAGWAGSTFLKWLAGPVQADTKKGR